MLQCNKPFVPLDIKGTEGTADMTKKRVTPALRHLQLPLFPLRRLATAPRPTSAVNPSSQEKPLMAVGVGGHCRRDGGRRRRRGSHSRRLVPRRHRRWCRCGRRRWRCGRGRCGDSGHGDITDLLQHTGATRVAGRQYHRVGADGAVGMRHVPVGAVRRPSPKLHCQAVGPLNISLNAVSLNWTQGGQLPAVTLAVKLAVGDCTKTVM
jgi:hypothetical protein